MKRPFVIPSSAIASHLFLQLVNILGQLIAVPLFIKNYSKSEYVLWILLNALTSFVLVADSAILQAFSIPLTRELVEQGTLNGYLLKRMVRILFGIEFLSVIILSIFFCFLHIDQNSSITSEKYRIFVLLILGNLLVVLQHYFLLHFQLQNIYTRGLRIFGSSKMVEMMSLLLLVTSSTNLTTIALSSIIVRGTSAIVMRRVVSQSAVSISENKIDLKGLRNNTLGSICLSGTTIFANQGVLIVIGHWSAANAILLFTITRMMCSPIRIIGDSIAIGSFPMRLRDTLMKVEPAKKFGSIFYLYGYFILGFFCIVIFLGPYVFHFLSDGKVAYSAVFLTLVAISISSDEIVAMKFQTSIIENNAFRIGLQYLTVTISELALLTFIKQFHNIQVAVALNILGDIMVFTLLARKK